MGCGLGIGPTRANGDEAVFRFDNIAVTGDDQRRVQVCEANSASSRRNARSERHSLASSTAVELAKLWRSERALRRLEALLASQT